MSPIDVCLCTNVRAAARALTRAYDRALESSGINVVRLAILGTLHAADEPIRIVDLAEALDAEHSTLVRDLKRLEADRLITRRPGRDARERRLALTRDGQHVLGQALALWHAEQERVHAELKSQDGPKLIALLRQVRAAVRDH